MSVAYDQITEVEDYSIEQRGRSKKPEGMTWALRFLRRGQSRGQIHLRFGESLTINELVTSAELEDGIVGDAKTAARSYARVRSRGAHERGNAGDGYLDHYAHPAGRR